MTAWSCIKINETDFVLKLKDGKFFQKLYLKLVQQKEVVDKDVSLGKGINLGTVQN